eukprot:GFKZ01013148.1.p1 GENE.GFKZ01013148.1~~GFKZ01013148.1.p1  ORF type:complete len:401 (-),score=50.96 GFKZ01013148.1:739-1941(-)
MSARDQPWVPPPLLIAPAFCFPFCSASPPVTRQRRFAAATCAAIALTISPSFLLAAHATPSPQYQQHQQEQQHLRKRRRKSPCKLSPLTTAIALHIPPSHNTPPSAHPPSTQSPITASAPSPSQLDDDSVPPIYASALIDQHYSQAPIWQFDNRPARARMSLPPRPEMSAEIRILTRLLVALVVGGSIGMERRAANSLAGVRTFSLVSLGAAIFMTTTLVAFPDADPTRVAAAISSSVGFLGAGVMSKNSKQSRGLTTASSVWLAAALGIAAACGMFLLSFAGAVSTVLIARYARFDSSLHLIRGDPVGHGVDDKDGSDARYSDMSPRRYMNDFGYYKGSNNEYTTPVYRYSGGSSSDPARLQALVDYDPSSQGVSGEEKSDDDKLPDQERGSGGEHSPS